LTTETREFSVRREQIALRAAHERHSVSARAAKATDVDLGNYAAVMFDSSLWVSATPLSPDAARPGVLGASLAWVVRSAAEGASRVVIVDNADEARAAIVARRAAYFDLPIDVLGAHGTAAPVAHGRAAPNAYDTVAPAEHAAVIAPRREHLECARAFATPGAEIVVEHGVVSFEVAGLEVARVGDEAGQSVVSIGVGAHDRETFRMLHGTTATPEQLRDVVRTVERHRSPGAPSHPLNLLAPERAMRSRATTNPQSIGLKSLVAVEPPVPRVNLKDGVPCCAVGRDANDADTVVVFVAGVDLDAVPFAADARDRHARGAQLLIVAPSRNIVPLQGRIAGKLREPARFVSA
jgi:hypothetical protein